MKMRVSSARTALCVSLTLTLFTLLASLNLEARKPGGNHVNPSASPATSTLSTSKHQMIERYAELPLRFEPNLGQTAPEVKYLSHGDGYELFLTPAEAILRLHKETKTASSNLRAQRQATANEKEAAVLRVEFAGANAAPHMEASDQLAGKTDYFIGSDRGNWHTDVPSFSRVKYSALYPGVDAVFYGNHRRLEYDFVVAPGTDSSVIAIDLQGAQKISINSDGNAELEVSGGQVEIDRPVAYQTIDGQRREIAANYEIAGEGRLKFGLGAYDHSQPLTIDPVLDYSTFLGGSAIGDAGYGIAVDASGNAYIAGTTYSLTFPNTANAYNQNSPGAGTTTNGAVFVTELNPTGSAELYSTYLSGDNGETGLGVAVDPVATASCPNGANPGVCIYVTGQTFSKDFPTQNAYLPGPLAADPGGAAFLAKINPALSGVSSLVYSSFLAGQNFDFGNSVAVDAASNAYITGYTSSPAGAATSGDFFVRGGFQAANGNVTNGNSFLIRVDTTQSGDPSLIYSTFLGGTTSTSVPGDDGNGVTVGASANAYVIGTTNSSDFPVTSATAFNATAPTGIANGAVFVTKINTAATGAGSLVYSTFLSGATTAGDVGSAIALKPGVGNVAYVTGSTTSAFPTTTGAPVATSTVSVVFVSEVDTSKSGSASVPYSATVGGSGGTGDAGLGIQVDTLGNIYVGGKSGSNNFPTTPGALQPTNLNPAGDAFVLKMFPGGNGAADVLYATYLGGSTGATPSIIRSLNLDATSNVYVTGQTSDTDFPHPAGAFQTSLTASDAGSTGSGFVSKLTLLPVLAFSSPCTFDFTISPTSSCKLTFTGNQPDGVTSAAQTFVVTNNTGSTITFQSLATSGTNSTDFAATGTAAGATAACSGTLAAGASCGFGVTFTPKTVGAESAILAVPYTYNNGTPTNGTASQTVELGGTGVAAHAIVVLNPLTTLNFATPQPVGTTSSALPVTVTNTGNINLTFSAAPSTGSTEFAVASGTTCTTTTPVAPNGTCTINVTFTPSAAGARSATLTLADNGTGSPQTLSLTGTGVASAPVVTLTPSTPISFGGQLVTTTSTAQTVTVKNTGNANLNITAAPAITGTNASDFAVATGTTCTSGATVAANGTCVIMITFTPPAGASGARSATLSIADNATGSPQTLALSGTPWDFTISASSATVTAGSSGTVTVTVTGIGGFTGAVTLSCTSGIPQGGCSAPGTPVNASATGATGTVTVTTHSLVLPPASRQTPPVSTQQLGVFLLALLMLLTLPVAGRFRTRMGLAGAAALLVIVAGCSSALPTPKGTYNVVITGTSGSVSHSVTASVTVN